MDATEVAPSQGVRWLQAQRLLVDRHRIGVTAQQLQRLPAPVPAFGRGRVGRAGQLHRGQGFAVPREQVQGDAAAEVVGAAAGIEGERAVVAGDRIVDAAERAQRFTAMRPGVGIGGSELDRALEHVESRLRSVQPEAGGAEVDQGGDAVGQGRQRFGEGSFGLGMAAGIGRGGAGEEQGASALEAVVHGGFWPAGYGTPLAFPRQPLDSLETTMTIDDLHGRYRHLREELDAAYAEPVWNSSRIDQIADQMIPVEYALASLQVAAGSEDA